MLNPTPIYKKTYFWLLLLPLSLILLWIFLFWSELEYLVYWWPGSGVTGGLPVEQAPLPAGSVPTLYQFDRVQYNRDIAIVILSVVFFFFYLLLSLWTISQFVLPVSQPSERLSVFSRLLLFLSRGHGPAVFVHEGIIKGTLEELQSSKPGVVFVDLTSALVLERQPYALSTASPVPAMEQRRRARQGAAAGEAAAAPPSSSIVRIAGPGITFTQAGERIRGVVSLRRQSRLQRDTKSITRDGFEVFAHINIVFTLGEPPEIVHVGYVGGDRPEDIHVLKLDKARTTILDHKDDLDVDDKQEVHRHYQHFTRFHDEETSAAIADNTPVERDTPYLFNPDRVFKAVYADSRNPSNNSTESWLDLPGRVAVEIFHNMISTQRYTDLYLPREEKSFPLNEFFKPEFMRRVRNQGVLSYQLIARKDELPLTTGQSLNNDEVDIFYMRQFHSPKLLRDRGIRVLSAGFSEIRPANPMVRQQLMDYWQAQWEKTKETSLASYDYQEIHLRARARIMAQNDIVKSFSQLLKDTTITREMAALRLFQAMEVFAKDPKTEKLLPQETLSMLSNMQEWLQAPLSLPSGESETESGENN